MLPQEIKQKILNGLTDLPEVAETWFLTLDLLDLKDTLPQLEKMKDKELPFTLHLFLSFRRRLFTTKLMMLQRVREKPMTFMKL